MIEPLDWLTFTAFLLTRTAGFAEPVPEAAAYERWAKANWPPWRSSAVNTTTYARCAADCGDGPDAAIVALSRVAAQMVRSTETGFVLAPDPYGAMLLRATVPLSTIQASAAVSTGATPQLGPALRPDMPPRLAQRLRDDGVADLHVHVGATLPFEVLMALLLEGVGTYGPARLGLAGIEFADSEGVRFPVLQLLATAAALLAAVVPVVPRAEEVVPEKPPPPLAALDPDFAESLAEGRVWAFMGAADPASVGGELRYLSEVTRWVERPWPPVSDGDRRSAALDTKLRLLQAATAWPGSWVAKSVENLFRCEAILHRALGQGARAGLGEFLLSSARLAGLRRTVADKGRVVELGLPHLGAGTALTRVELRTAEQSSGPERVTASDLARSLDVQFSGYLRYCAGGPAGAAPVSVGWPICLIRAHHDSRRATPSDLGGGQMLRFRLNHLWDVVAASAELLNTCPATRALVPGLDVAGEEHALPSWCFALLFDEFRRRLSAPAAGTEVRAPAFRVHAGESYARPLQGLRKIDEAVRYVLPVDCEGRLGHALALADDWSLEHSAQEQTADEAFDDLVWAWRRLEDLSRKDADAAFLRGSVENALLEAGARLYPSVAAHGPTASDYAVAYERRFKRDALLAAGVLALSATDGSAMTLNDGPVQPGDSLADRILAEYFVRTPLDDPLLSPLIEPLRLADAYERLRPAVTELVVDRGVVVECCPTSNVIIGGIGPYRRHPFAQLQAAGVPVTLNTDDPGIFHTCIGDEYALMWSGLEARGIPLEGRLDMLSGANARARELFDSGTVSSDTASLVARAQAEFRAHGFVIDTHLESLSG